MNPVTVHYRLRALWITGAAASLVVAVCGHWWPWINIYVAPPSAWIWCVVGAGYHHGWINAHRKATKPGKDP